MTPKIVRTLNELRAETLAWRKAGLTQAVVPTMGALHDGHLRLVTEGLARADRVTATIFVNPRQFAAHEDLGRYPRDEEADVAKLGGAGAHLVFAPPPEVIYPQGFATTVSLTGPAKAGLEDRFRPLFFDGVATVVAKLFNETGADYAMFGEKDYQQLMVVARMAQDLDMQVQVIGVATEREEDSLAMSSRNAYLSAVERLLAPAMFRSLNKAASAIRAGRAANVATAAARRSLRAAGFRVDYVAARHALTLTEPQPGDPIRLLAAAWLGKTRLIDNIAV